MGTPLLVFADDWGRHPSSCQHLVRQLLPSCQTTWVNTIGTRTPRLDLTTVKRAAGKFGHWFKKQSGQVAEPLPANLYVAHPKMWPWFTRKLDRQLNRKLLLKQLAPVVAAMPTLPVAMTTLPIVADLMEELPVAKWVYYCVDDFSKWPGLDQKTMAHLEEIVVSRADTIVAVSENLRTRLRTLGRESTLLTHGVDTPLWQQPGLPIPELAQWEQPLVVFWGVVDQRMETSWVQALSRTLTCGTIVLAGPQQDPDQRLRSLPRVVMPGALHFQQLPTLAQAATVLVMPYVDQPVTRAMQPLKLKEYLATGKPAVARDLPANLEWADALDLVSTANDFVAAVMKRLQSGIPPEQSTARQRLNHESWAGKAQQLAMMLQLDTQR